MIGASLRRREDGPLLRGAGSYVDDLVRPGLLHAAVVRSPHAHARVVGVRAPAAAPGLVAVLTARELRGRARTLPVGGPPGVELADAGHPALADGEVLYVGQPVLLVIAASRAAAEDATELVEIDYEPLAAVIEPSAATETLARYTHAEGDVAAAFDAAAHVVTGRYALPRLIAAPIEPRGALAEPGPGADELTVWCSMQDQHRPLAQLSHVLDRPRDSIRIVIPDVGGAFGSKGVVAPEVAAIALAALDLGRPVKWVEDRTENGLAAYQGRGIEGDLELALDGEGRMLALRGRLRADLGAYLLTTTAIPPHTAASLLTGPYDIAAAAVEVAGMRTHKVPTGPYRGAGRPDAAYLLERLVDDAARRLGIDPAELRRRNLITAFPHHTPTGLTYDSGDFPRLLDTALELAAADPPPAPPRGWIRGRGLAMYVERAAGGWESAEAWARADGTVLVASSASPHGQGHATTFAQIAADRLELDPARIALRFGDSARDPAGVGTFGSRSVAVAGSAVARVCEGLVAAGRARAAAITGTGADGVRYRGGLFTAGERELGWAELAASEALHARARFDSERVFSSGAYVAEVAIDPETGRLAVVRVVAVDDAGTIINPLLAHGQVLGGVVQALGECLLEEAVYDEDGQLRTATFMDYALMSAAEVPEIRLGEIASPTPHNPLGAKGVGEGGAIGTLAAVANAVAAALGGRHVDPPYRSETLWRALAGQPSVG